MAYTIGYLHVVTIGGIQLSTRQGSYMKLYRQNFSIVFVAYHHSAFNEKGGKSASAESTYSYHGPCRYGWYIASLGPQ